ncbi:hypothetical protein [Gimesia fumaroli]|jgi:hypothetical protein|uniref:Uncharacterized protein n=1 Tax=Gimesia fumaroli TaxID=2527976 RepID=A0A518IBU0_9PLAN|nr:hypothetical protein [Gimesia fumaroli]QDV50510.1 hypothetical protein Enr17x_25510 [Gimesia fumaroli]
MKKTGIIILALTGISAPFLLKTVNSEQIPSQQSRSKTLRQQPILQQIPARLAHKNTLNQITDAAAQKPESTGSFEGFSSEQILAKLVGKWEQTKSSSKQILTIKENGTATMLIEPQGLWTAVLGKQVTIDIEWSLNAATLTLRAVGGKPENKLDYIRQLWGSEFVREINSIEDKMFTLRDNKGDVSQKWIRTAY